MMSHTHKAPFVWSEADWKAVSDRSWMWNKGRRVMTGFHIPDVDQLPPEARDAVTPLARIDPAGLARTLKRTGVEVFYFYSKCHFGNAYYPTRHGHVHSVLDGRDLFGELTRACLDEGILPGSVYEVSDQRIPKDHPDWCHRNVVAVDLKTADITDESAGTKIAGPCINGPYGEMVIEQLREVAERYPLACLWIDFLGLFGSWDAWRCPFCNALYKAEFGREFPGTARLAHDEYVRYVRWRHDITERYTARLCAAIRQARPAIGITQNFFAFSPIGEDQTRWEIAGTHADFLGKDLFPYRSGQLQASWKPRAMRGPAGKPPPEMLLDGNMALPTDLATTKPLDGYRSEIWTVRLAGAQYCGSINPSCKGEYDPALFPLLRKVFDEQHAVEHWLRDSEPAVRVGLLRSVQTLQFDRLAGDALYPAGMPARDRPDAALHYREFIGWAQVLIEHHELWDHRHDAQISDEALAGLDTLILPHATCLSDRQLEAVRRFVAAGGTLIATGGVSLKDGDGRLRGRFGLADVLGVELAGPGDPALKRLYQAEPPLDPRPDWVSAFTAVPRGHFQVRARPGASILARAARMQYSMLTYSEAPCDAPSITCHPYGKGRAYYLAALLGEQYFEDGQFTAARLMRGLLDHARPGPRRFDLDAPGSVELFVRRLPQRPGTWLIGCVQAETGLSRPDGLIYTKTSSTARAYTRKFDAVETMPALHGIRLRIAAPEDAPVRVVRLPEEQTLPCTHCGDIWEADLSPFRVAALVRVEGVAP